MWFNFYGVPFCCQWHSHESWLENIKSCTDVWKKTIHEPMTLWKNSNFLIMPFYRWYIYYIVYIQNTWRRVYKTIYLARDPSHIETPCIKNIMICTCIHILISGECPVYVKLSYITSFILFHFLLIYGLDMHRKT